jgi:hypothetical protein
MKHPHYECIVAWAEGKTIQFKNCVDTWTYIANPMWDNYFEYRVKPEPKPDYVHETRVYAPDCPGWRFSIDPNLRLTFDGETGELKSAEVLK